MNLLHASHSVFVLEKAKFDQDRLIPCLCGVNVALGASALRRKICEQCCEQPWESGLRRSCSRLQKRDLELLRVCNCRSLGPTSVLVVLPGCEAVTQCCPSCCLSSFLVFASSLWICLSLGLVDVRTVLWWILPKRRNLLPVVHCSPLFSCCSSSICPSFP